MGQNPPSYLPIILLLLAVFTAWRIYFYFNYFKDEQSAGYILSHPYTDLNGLQVIRANDYLIKTAPYPKFYAGEYISFEAKDVVKLGATKLIYYPRIATDETKEISILKSIAQFRENLVKRVQSHMILEPHSTLLLGMTIGYKDSFTADFERIMQISGLSHVIVVSGYNVNLIIGFVQKLLLSLGFGRKQFLFITSVFLSIFLLLVGPDPPVLRAVIFGYISCLALFMGEVKNSVYLLVLVGVVLVMINPGYVVNLSFILSFAATFAVITISPIIKDMPQVKADFLMIIWVNIILIPILSYFFEEYSFAGILINLIAAPLIPLITILGVVYVIFPNAILGFLLIPLLGVFIEIAEVGKYIVFLMVRMKFSLPAIVTYYFVILIVLRIMNLYVAEKQKVEESR